MKKSSPKKSFIANYLGNLRLVFFAYLAAFIVGIIALVQLPKEIMPSVNLPVIIASSVMPGASPDDIEELVTNPLEDNFRNIKGIKTINSMSMENSSITILQFEDNFSIDKAQSEVQKQVDNTVLPDEVSNTFVSNIDFDEMPVWTFAVSGNDKIGLNVLADRLVNEMEKITTIDRVEVSGTNKDEFVVYLDNQKLTQLGLHPAVLQQAIAAVSNSLPAGNIIDGNFKYSVGIDKSLVTLDDLRQLPIVVNGQNYVLGEIAQVYQQHTADSQNAYQMDKEGNIRQVVTFNVYKVPGSPIDKNAKLSRQTVESVLKDYPQFELYDIENNGQKITDTFVDLGKNTLATFLLVFLVMLVFLGTREAIISSVSIPIVMLFSFGAMMAFGISLNFVSLFALLLVLGMLVDNAIVVTTALNREYHRDPSNAISAGVNVWKEYFAPLVATNLTTVWAFLPLLLMSGVMGVFLRPISIVVTVAILVSAVVAILLTLPLGVFVLNGHVPSRIKIFLQILTVAVFIIALVFFLPKNIFLVAIIPLACILLYLLLIIFQKKVSPWIKLQRYKLVQKGISQKLKTGFINTEKLENFYQKIVGKILGQRKNCWKLLAAIVIFTVTSFSLLGFGLVKNEFFPKETANSLDMIFTLPSDVSGNHSEEIILEILPKLQNLPSVNYVTASVGGDSSQLIGGNSTNQISFNLNLLPKKEQSVNSIELAQLLRDQWSNNDYGSVIVQESSSMSALGSDLGLIISGEDLTTLSQKSEELVSWLKQQPGVIDVETSISQSGKRLVFVPDEKVLAQYNVSRSNLLVYLRSNLSGWPLGKIKNDGEDVDIVLYTQKDKAQIEQLNQIQIPTTQGYLPISTFGKFVSKNSLLTIDHQDYERIVTISAGVQDGYSATDIGKNLLNFAQNDLNLPDGYTAAESEMLSENSKSISTLMLAMSVAALLIVVTLVLQLKSFRKAAIVVSVIPVAISGVFIVFALFGMPLSLPALIGVLALFGIVVNNSILIVERINQNLDSGMKLELAIIDGSVSRLQPILLTSLTTIIGLVPITFSDPMWRGLGSAIIAGLTFSGTLLLFYIPALYYLIFKPRK